MFVLEIVIIMIGLKKRAKITDRTWMKRQD